MVYEKERRRLPVNSSDILYLKIPLKRMRSGTYQATSIKMRHLRDLIKIPGVPKWWLTNKQDFLVLGKKKEQNKDVFDPVQRIVSDLESESLGDKLCKMTIKISKAKSGIYYYPSIRMKQLRQLQQFITRKYWYGFNEELIYLEGQKQNPSKSKYNQLLGYPKYLFEELMTISIKVPPGS